MDSSSFTLTATGAELTTPLGVIDVRAQDGRTFYVRAGQADDTELGEAPRRPLRIGRHVELRARMHFQTNGGARWRADHPFVYRVDQPGKLPTQRMVDKLQAELGAAVQAFAETPEGAELLDRRETSNAIGEAASRTAIALRLRECADQLDREAHELVNGGRVEHLRGTINCFDVRTTQVRTAAGELMPPIKTPPTIYGSTDHPDAIANQRPER